MICDILYDDLTRFVHKMHKYSVKKLIWNNGTKTFYLLHMIAIINFYMGESLHPVPTEWEPQIAKNCAHLKRD